MHVLLVTLDRVIDVGAGDFRQAVCTAEALARAGVSVLHCSSDGSTSGSKFPVAERSDIQAADVIHFLPGPPVLEAETAFDLSKFRGVVASSPVYWESLKHRWITKKEGIYGVLTMANYGRMVARSLFGLSPPQYTYADVVLPNTFAEARSLARFNALDESILVRPVCNGLDPEILKLAATDRSSHDLARNSILYPGIFARRKNQRRFIEALSRSCPGQVIFMGGPHGNGPRSQVFLEECMRIAPRHWRFVGKVPYLSEEFVDLMRGARVACLCSSCETPGLALLESALFGARPVITSEGGTKEYFADIAEYVNPVSRASIRKAVWRAWERGPLERNERAHFERFTWDAAALATVSAYREVLARARH